MEYKKTIAFEGDWNRAVETARVVLTTNNYRIESVGGAEIVASGPGVQGTKQNPLLGATRIRISLRASAIELSADLGGVRWMSRFLYLFPPALALLLTLAFLAAPMPAFVLLVPLLAVAPWLIISPLMVRWIRNRTTNALDTLLHNMTMDRRSAEGGNALPREL